MIFFKTQDSVQKFKTSVRCASTGREALHMQGLQYPDDLLDQFRESQLQDLAGNGFLGVYSFYLFVYSKYKVYSI